MALNAAAALALAGIIHQLQLSELSWLQLSHFQFTTDLCHHGAVFLPPEIQPLQAFLEDKRVA